MQLAFTICQLAEAYGLQFSRRDRGRHLFM